MMMSTRKLEENFSLLENEERLLDLKSCEKSSLQSQHNLDIFSVGSGSPALIKDGQSKSNYNQQTEELLAQALDAPGTLGHLHRTSPLESIRELIEMEERSEGRSPGDGEVRVKDMSHETVIRHGELSSEGRDDVLERTALGQVSNPQFDLLDTCGSPDDVPAESRPPEDTYIALIPGHLQWAASDHQKDVEGHQLTSSQASSGVLVTPLQEESTCPQPGIKVKRISDETEEENPNLGGVDGHVCEKEGSVNNQTLIEVLTACEARVEQLEELKSSSIEMSTQLQSAQVLTARLHQKVLHLEHECHLKDKELHDLMVSLEKTNKALQIRNSEMAAVTEELHRLHLELEVQKETAVSANGRLIPNAHRRDGTSKVCTLL